MSLIRHIAPVKQPGSLLHHLFCLLILAGAFQLGYTVSLRVCKDANCLCCLLQQTVAHQNSDFITWLAEAEAGVWKSSPPFWWAIASKNEPEASFICSVVYLEKLGLTSGSLILPDEHISVGCFLLSITVMEMIRLTWKLKRKKKKKTQENMSSFQIDRNEGIYWSRWCWMFLKIFVLDSSLFWKHWNRGYIPIKEFNR